MRPLLLCIAMLVAVLRSGAQDVLTPAEKLCMLRLQQDVQRKMAAIDWTIANRTTSGAPVLYTIPVVVHVLHDYGEELIADTEVYHIIRNVNSFLLKQNADTTGIIDKYRQQAANTQIALKLANKDPYGQPTKGIEHIHTYLTRPGINQSKLHQWPQDRYLNIWVVSYIPGFATGSASTPYIAAYQPFYDGIILYYGGIEQGNIIANLTGQFLNLSNPCNIYSTACVDNDVIPDTPPCGSSTSYTCPLFDTVCDTPNAQNIMNLSGCGKMFTYGQGQYMQYVLQLDYGKRDSLVSSHNMWATGVNEPAPDLAPIADFGLSDFFVAQGQAVTFINRSWNDTITGAAWTFSNNALIATSTTASYVVNKFGEPGWATVSLTAAGNNTGTNTLNRTRALYIADTNAITGTGYIQDFEAGGDADKWPIFNYFDNAFRWQLNNGGYYGGTCLQYAGYDVRTYPQNMTGTPYGDYDDIFTPGFDLTGFGGDCFLNFVSCGARLVATPSSISDSLQISFSTNPAGSWQPLATISGDELDNMGESEMPFTPAGPQDWIAHAVLLPTAAKTKRTFFRLRYKPGADSHSLISTGNNFYLDHFNFGLHPADVAQYAAHRAGVAIMPNPTTGNSFVIVCSPTPIPYAVVSVTDIRGSVVYSTMVTINDNKARIEIPATKMSSGIYFVRVTTNGMSQTEKLLVR